MDKYLDRRIVWEHVNEVLKMTGSKERHIGTVTGIDKPGTTLFITTDDGRKLLAFQGNPIMRPGDRVSFRISQHRAVDIVKLEQPVTEKDSVKAA